jgi:hypothetical protein
MISSLKRYAPDLSDLVILIHFVYAFPAPVLSDATTFFAMI